MTSSLTCQGCDKALPPQRRGGMPRKWCSERCRKRSYGDPCVDCGARTGFGAERARVPDPRCRPCAEAKLLDERAAYRQMIEEMWAKGMTARQIGDVLGIKAPNGYISRLRSRGYSLPHRRTPEQIARMTADDGAHLRWARAVQRVRRMAA